MLWRRPLPAPRGMPRRSSRRHLHPPNPRRPGRPPGAQWQEPARPTDDDRYSSFPPFFWREGSLAVTLFFVERPLQHRERPRIMLHLRTRFWSNSTFLAVTFRCCPGTDLQAALTNAYVGGNPENICLR